MVTNMHTRGLLFVKLSKLFARAQITIAREN